MILYKNTKQGFFEDIKNNLIADKIEEEFNNHQLSHNNIAEYRAWTNSLPYMRNALDDDEIDKDCTVAIEYQIPLTSKRVDFLIAGKDKDNHSNIIVVELKQWEDSELTDHDYLVRAYTGGAYRLVTHPSYQAYSYAKIISNFNEDILLSRISLYPCSYLHNYKERNREHIENDFYQKAIELSPIFLKRDAVKFRNFIKKYVVRKGEDDLLLKVENGKLKPSKSLQDSISSMMKGNEEFCLIDEQMVVYQMVKEKVLSILRKNIEEDSKKYTFIIQGGPGTGKSVLAIKLLADLIMEGYSANYVTKNHTPRDIYFEKLKQDNYRLSYIKSLFKSSGSFINCKKDIFDCLLVDEAHRLNMKSGLFQKGENQTKEIIRASKVSVFFIDEAQVVATNDVGSISFIKKCAEEEESEVISGDDFILASQFRCDGSDGYIAFLDNILGIRKTANEDFSFDYDFRLYSNPSKMREDLKVYNQKNNKSRMLAGYCYDWVSKKDESLYDICLGKDFRAKWNLGSTNTWAIDKDSFSEVGCIHTCQGIEFEYVGVIIAKDLIYRDGMVQTDYTKRSKDDKTMRGIKKTKDYALADKIIRNTYRVLLSRGQKGCFVYAEDKELLEYLSEMTKKEIIS